MRDLVSIGSILAFGMSLSPGAFACDLDPKDPRIDAWSAEFGDVFGGLIPDKMIGDVPRFDPRSISKKLSARVGIPAEVFNSWEANYDRNPAQAGWTFKDEAALVKSTTEALSAALGKLNAAAGRCRMKRSDSGKWIGGFVRKFGKKEVAAHEDEVRAFLLEYVVGKPQDCMQAAENEVFWREADFQVAAVDYYQSLLDFIRTLPEAKRKSLEKGIRFLEGYLVSVRNSSFVCDLFKPRIEGLRKLYRAAHLPKAMVEDLKKRLAREGGVDLHLTLVEFGRSLGEPTSEDDRAPPSPLPHVKPPSKDGRTI